MITDPTSLKLHLIFAQHTELLTRALIHHLGNLSPFSCQTILVPNSGMQRYLQLELTKQKQLLAHVDITYLGHYLWAKNTQSLHTLPDIRALAFAIDALLTQPLFQHARLQTHLALCKTRRHHFSLATELAALLLNYAKHRPIWLDKWCKGEHVSAHPDETWQKALFLALLPNFPNLRQSASLSSESTESSPQALHVFGFHAMPETQRLALWQLAQSQPVQFYLLSPSTQYWLDISKSTQITHAELAEPDTNLHHDIGNPLLANWGKTGKHLFSTLIEDAKYEAKALNFEPDTHLSQLQRRIDQLGSALKPCKHDQSISLHACASPRREVEVLFDWICQQLDADSTLNLSDFIVMMPNIRDYASNIHAVFGESRLRFYSVANQTESVADPNIRAFLAMLTVLRQRFSVSAFFDFCSQTAICEAFSIDTNDLATIRHWFISANLNWGVTPEQKSEYANDNILTHQGSLEKLIDELNLANLFGDIDNLAVQKHFRITQLPTLIKLNRLLAIFNQFALISHQSKSLSEWHSILLDMVAHCQLESSEKLQNGLTDWAAPLDLQDTTKQPFDIVFADITAFFDQRELHGPFLSGGITFCAMQPMRAIPARVICMLGLNQDFPKPDVLADYDLRKTLPQRYDVLRHDEQKYLMLETILSARDMLYLSYQGTDEKNAKPLPPSPLVAELVQFFKQSGIDMPHKTHTLQRFTPEADWKIYQQKSPYSKTETKTKSETNEEDNELDLLRTYTVDVLASYLVSPVKAYLDFNRIRVGKPNADLSEFEMLLPNGLDKYVIGKTLLEDNDTNLNLRQQNRLPAQVLQTPVFEQQNTNIHELKQTHKAILSTLLKSTDELPPEEILIDNTRITFSCNPLFGNTSGNVKATRYLYDVSRLKLHTLIHAWLTAVCAQIDDKPVNTILLFKKDQSNLHHLSISTHAEQAEQALREIITIISLCETQPTPYEYTLKSNRKTANNLDICQSDISSFEQSLLPLKLETLPQEGVTEMLTRCLTRILSDFTVIE